MFFRRKKTKYSDEELLKKYQETLDSEYFGILYDRYIPLIYGLSLKYLKNENEAKDAVMQLFEDLLTKVTKHKIETFRTWVYSVAKNNCLLILRKKKIVTVDLKVNLIESDFVSYLLNDDDEDEVEYTKYLKYCLDRLPKPQHICINKFFVDNQSYAEIVDSTGYSFNNVKSYIQNAKRNLKICIERQASENE